jgi:uncharacterized protein
MIRKRRFPVVKTAALILLGAALSRAQEAGSHPRVPTVRATGEAAVNVRPDLALLDIGVTTQAQTAQAAGAQNAKGLDQVTAQLRRTLGASADIRTINHSLTPNYRYPKEGGQPSISGYTASNIVQIKTGDLDNLGKLIDAVTQSGANTIQGLQFTLKDEASVQAQALREAAAKARVKVEAMAASLGLKVVRIISVEESQPAVVRPVMMARAEAAAVATPVSPGTIEVHATVILTAEVQ